MNKIIAWLATKFVGKKTYATILAAVLKQITEALGVSFGPEEISITIDVALGLLTALFYRVAKEEK